VGTARTARRSCDALSCKVSLFLFILVWFFLVLCLIIPAYTVPRNCFIWSPLSPPPFRPGGFFFFALLRASFLAYGALLSRILPFILENTTASGRVPPPPLAPTLTLFGPCFRFHRALKPFAVSCLDPGKVSVLGV